VNTRSKRLLRNFLCGITLVGSILSTGLGSAVPSSAHTGPAAVPLNPIFLPLVVRPPADQTLTVKKSGSGSGRVTSDPAGIDCGSACSAAFNFGTRLTLMAAAGAGSTFSGWSGDCIGTGSCVVTMDAARSVTANFAVKTQQLRIGLSGTGSGTVTSEPAGIDCGSACFAYFTYNTVVTLTATPVAPSTFAGWNGGGCTGTGTCQVTMNADQQVSAAFILPCSGIENCGFEAGSGVGWTEYSSNGFHLISDCSDPLNCNDIPPRTGNYLAWLGAAEKQGIADVSYIQQKISIPSSAPYLVYWQWIESEDPCLGCDYVEVLINNVVVEKYDLYTGMSTVEWVQHNIDLSHYLGQSVTLKIRVSTDDSNISNLYLDDVSLQASP
jgi:hypothetical protein